MSKKMIGIIILIILVGGTFFMVLGGMGSGNTSMDHSGPNLKTITSESTVTIDLTPKEFDGKNFYVDVSLNTHSEDLSQFNLKELITLEINDRVIAPVSAPKLSGHHNSGTLIFEVEEKPKEFTIKIKDLPDLPVRVFKW